ncbi:PTS glucose transporter subunit IIA, partial [Klebsiella pneumoniae]|uniref:PTS glucose transporter subunit IIA n=1 Tax=Klebsiella pneumoniae TaxID=573 RepID=UPI003C7FE292
FDKLKSLVSDDKKDTGTIEIVAPLAGEIVNIEDVPDVVFAEKIVGDGIAIKPTGNKTGSGIDSHRRPLSVKVSQQCPRRQDR